MSLFREEIIERYRFPRYRGIMQNPHTQGEVMNALCGDELTLFLRFDPVRDKSPEATAAAPLARRVSNGVDEKKSAVADAKFQGEGCALMTAAADILCEAITDKNRDELKEFSAENLLALYGESPSPARLKCVLLPYEALKQALAALF